MRLFFKESISVYRLASTGTEKYDFNGTIYGTIMGIRPEDAMLSEGNPAQMAMLFTYYYSDIKEGDKLVYNSNNYIIKGVRLLNPIRTTLRYKKAIIYLMNS